MGSILSTEEARLFLDSKEYLLFTPNVVSLGFINEEVDGKSTERMIFRVGVIEINSEENMKYPDIFVHKLLEHTRSKSNEVVRIPVKVVEEGVLKFLMLNGEGNPENNAPYRGGSLITRNPEGNFGCLGANARYQESYCLLSAAHVLTEFKRCHIGHEILVKNNEGFVRIGARITGQVEVSLYDTRYEHAEFAKQDLAWADITDREGSPEIRVVGTPNPIRPVENGELVKYYGGYSGDKGRNVKVKGIMSKTRLEVSIPGGGTKYAFFKDVCLIEPKNSKLREGDSGTAIVAEKDNALLGILMSGKYDDEHSMYYFSKLVLDS